MPEKKSNLDAAALSNALKASHNFESFVKELEDIIKDYEPEVSKKIIEIIINELKNRNDSKLSTALLRVVINHFGLHGVAVLLGDAENVDKEELKKQVVENAHLEPVVPKSGPGPYESDELNKFGMYRMATEAAEATSGNQIGLVDDETRKLYNPAALESVLEDSETHGHSGATNKVGQPAEVGEPTIDSDNKVRVKGPAKVEWV